MKFLNKYLMLLILALTGLAYCGDPVPMEELNNAKVALSEAELLKAEKYAKAHYKSAKNELFKAHNLMADGDFAGAKQAAINAAKKANYASKVSGPLAINDMVKETKDLQKKAQDAYAEQFAPEELQSGNTKLTEGLAAKEKEDYKAAFLELEAAKEAYTKAINICMAQKAQLLNTIQEIENNLEQAKSYEAKKYTPGLFDKAMKNLAIGKKALENDNLKDAVPKIQKAKTQSEKILKLAQKRWALNKKNNAEQAVANAESMIVEFKINYEKSLETYEDAKYDLDTQEENLAASQEALKSAGSYFKQEQYDESYKQSEEAQNLAMIVLEQIPNIQNKLIEYMNAECPEGMVKDEKGKNCIGGEGGVETVSELGPKPQPPKGWKAYKVKLNPAKRDCLWRIASYKYIYSDYKRWPRIYKANKYKIKNPDLIYPGQILAIPPKYGNVDALIAEKKAYPKKLKEWLEKQKEDEDYEEDESDEDIEEEAPDDYFVPSVNTSDTETP
jgi:nucleoid-associated protein YgaU